MLIKSLPRIAAKVLKNTHVGQTRMKEKFLLIDEAYGTATVEADFESWCHEQVQKGVNPRYPLTEYIKVIDTRLGGGFSDPSLSQFDLTDPQIAHITSKAYEQTGYLPSNRCVAALLKVFTEDDLVGALDEYASTLEDKEMKSCMRQFFLEGGASAVIYARQKREKK